MDELTHHDVCRRAAASASASASAPPESTTLADHAKRIHEFDARVTPQLYTATEAEMDAFVNEFNEIYEAFTKILGDRSTLRNTDQ